MGSTIKVHEIFLSSGHDFKDRHGKERLRNATKSVAEAKCVAGQGLEGDRFFGHADDYKGQVTLISLECIQDMERDLGIEVGDLSEFRRNVVVSGVDLNVLVGKTFRLGEVELSGSEECAPCSWMEVSIAPGAHAALKHRGGLRCRILSTGTIRTGESEFEII